MKALRSFTVRPSLPPELSALEELAFNLRWSWDDQTRDLFRWVDPDLWDASVHDPVRLLGLVPRERLDALARDAGFKRFLGEVRSELQRYLDGERWFQTRATARSAWWPTSRPSSASPRPSPSTRAAWACWPATTSSRPATWACRWWASGLLYRHGYFRQSLDADGWQQERYPCSTRTSWR